jgi:hypothetical protein
MRLDEFDSFKGEMKQLCASLGKPYTDALGQAYWARAAGHSAGRG